MKKRVDQLQPGDILVYTHDVYGNLLPTPLRSIMVGVFPDNTPGSYEVHQVHQRRDPPSISTFTRSGSVEMDVESTLTQQHADELLTAARHYLATLTRAAGEFDPDVIALRSLLALFEPPTSEELADMLREMLLPPGPTTYARAKEMLRRRGGK